VAVSDGGIVGVGVVVAAPSTGVEVIECGGIVSATPGGGELGGDDGAARSEGVAKARYIGGGRWGVGSRGVAAGVGEGGSVGGGGSGVEQWEGWSAMGEGGGGDGGGGGGGGAVAM